MALLVAHVSSLYTGIYSYITTYLLGVPNKNLVASPADVCQSTAFIDLVRFFGAAKSPRALLIQSNRHTCTSTPREFVTHSSEAYSSLKEIGFIKVLNP